MNWKESNKFEILEFDENKVFNLYGDYIKDELTNYLINLKMEEVIDKLILPLSQSVNLSQFELFNNFSVDTLNLLDTVIGNGFKDLSDQELNDIDLENVIITLGTYLGTIIIETVGGSWRFREQPFHNSIFFTSKNIECFPFHIIAKRLLDADKSLEEYYNDILKYLTNE